MHKCAKIFLLPGISCCIFQAEEAKVKILEVSGDRVDNKSKLEIIKQEEEMIQLEKAELERLRQEEELKKAQAKAKLETEAALLAAQKMVRIDSF